MWWHPGWQSDHHHRHLVTPESSFQVLEPSSFYPAAWMQQSKLTEGRTKKDWEKVLCLILLCNFFHLFCQMFERTYAVHFFHTSSHNHQVSQNNLLQKQKSISRNIIRYDIFLFNKKVQKPLNQDLKSLQKIKRPKFYGARKPAYLYLALQHCPISFWSAQDF